MKVTLDTKNRDRIAQNYVQVIKEIRNVLGLHLKPAKDVADLLRDGRKQVIAEIPKEVYDQIEFGYVTANSDYGITYTPGEPSKQRDEIGLRLHQLILTAVKHHEHSLAHSLNEVYLMHFSAK